MAYDDDLAARFRAALNGLPELSKRRMMGGVCFMLSGNMIGGAHREKSGEGRFMFRVGSENHSRALERVGARPMKIGGRPMAGFIFVEAEDCADPEVLADWIAFAHGYVASLPPKPAKPAGKSSKSRNRNP